MQGKSFPKPTGPATQQQKCRKNTAQIHFIIAQRKQPPPYCLAYVELAKEPRCLYNLGELKRSILLSLRGSVWMDKIADNRKPVGGSMGCSPSALQVVVIEEPHAGWETALGCIHHVALSFFLHHLFSPSPTTCKCRTQPVNGLNHSKLMRLLLAMPTMGHAHKRSKKGLCMCLPRQETHNAM